MVTVYPSGRNSGDILPSPITLLPTPQLPLPFTTVYPREGTQGCQQTSKGNNIIFGSLLGSYLTYNGLLVSS